MSTTDVTNASEHGEAEAHDDHHGLSDMLAVKIFVFLAIVTGAEVALSYMIDDLGPLFLPLLLVLMVVKFFVVVAYFMHLKFDDRWFSVLFYMGLFLAVGVYIVALFTFRFFSS